METLIEALGWICRTVAVCAFAYLAWKMSDSLLCCKEHLEDIADYLNDQRNEPIVVRGDADGDSSD